MNEDAELASGRRDPEAIEVHDAELRQAWAGYHASGMSELITSSYLCMILDACSRLGLLQRLAAGVTDDAELFRGTDRALATHILRYLEVQGVVTVSNGVYSLTGRGRLLASDISLALLGFYGQAYGPVVQQATELLAGRAVYGRDITRDTGALGYHSAALFHRFHTPIVLRAMASMDATCILDLGCGAGRLLVDACNQNPTLRGVGLDIAADAIDLARELAHQSGLDDRTDFVVADAFQPDKWPAVCHQADALFGVGVLHEYFREGEDGVIEVLNRYAALLRNGVKGFLLGEPELCYDRQEDDSEFFLVHALTAQGLPRHRESWLALFDRTQLRCRSTFTRPGAGQRLVFYDLVAA